jgi:hypothetical protein
MTDFQAGAEKTKAVAPCQENTASEKTLQAKSSTEPAILKSRSTSTDDQHAKLLAMLRLGPQTTYTLRKHGIAQCAARIFFLRNQGYNITTERVRAVDSDGYTHVGVARYTLMSKKSEGAQ